MNAFITIILIAITYIATSESTCSSDTWTAVSNYDTTKILGKWYVTTRYKNGQHGHSHCLWSNLSKHPTLVNTLVETTNLLFKNGKSKTKRSQRRLLTFLDPTKTDGIIRVEAPNGSVVIKFIVALKHDEYAFLKSCDEGIEYFWIYLRSLTPTKETLEKVSKIMGEQNLDNTKVIAS